jgi:hypothetical protein
MYASRSVSFCYSTTGTLRKTRRARLQIHPRRPSRSPKTANAAAVILRPASRRQSQSPQFVSLSLESHRASVVFFVREGSRLLSFYSLALTSCAYSTTYVTQCGGNRHICPPDVCSDGASLALHVGDLVGLLPARLYRTVYAHRYRSNQWDGGEAILILLYLNLGSRRYVVRLGLHRAGIF